MKKLFILFLITALYACTERTQTGFCYTCNVVGGNPYQDRTFDTCSVTPASQYSFKDANGNDLSWHCAEK